MLTTTRHVGSVCPHCGHRLDAATASGEQVPEPGDLSVCVYCAVVLVFCSDLTLRLAGGAELVALDHATLQRLHQLQRLVAGLEP